MDTSVEFYLPVMDKYREYKIYCPNQDTFESEEIEINDTPRQETQTRTLWATWYWYKPSLYKTIFMYNFKNNIELL